MVLSDFSVVEKARRWIVERMFCDDPEVDEGWTGKDEARELVEELEYLNCLGRDINRVNKANGWDVPNVKSWEDERYVASMLVLIHSEVSEALEALRHRDMPLFKEELADVLIRTLDLGVGMGADMDREVRVKLNTNSQRGHRHGGKRI